MKTTNKLRSNNITSPILRVFIAYQAKNKNWRGFCYPFDVTCEGFTKDQVMKKLKKLVDLYCEGLKEYEYPQHLLIRKLTDEQDRVVFSRFVEHITKEIEERLINYDLGQEKERQINLYNPITIGYYNDFVLA